MKSFRNFNKTRKIGGVKSDSSSSSSKSRSRSPSRSRSRSRSPSPPANKRDILIIFDIDETLVQFINKKSYHYWEQASPDEKRKLENGLEYVEREERKQIIFLRPKLREFIKLVQENPRVKIALWTYSDREYAEGIAKIIAEKFDVPKDIFLFTYGEEDITDHKIPKSLNKIWDDPKYNKKFNKFNTFLIDDRLGNLCHKVNEMNGVLVQAFAPFGETKAREKTTDKLIKIAVEDTMLVTLSKIIDSLLKDIDGCSNEEISEAFNNEPIFATKCVKRKKLEQYVKPYNGCSLITIGDVQNAASEHKGGRKSRKKRRKRRKFNKKSKKLCNKVF